jgi:hypothetical protein
MRFIYFSFNFSACRQDTRHRSYFVVKNFKSFVNQKQLILTIDIYGSIINIQTIPREIWMLLYTSLLQN